MVAFDRIALQRKDRIIEALNRIVLQGSEIRPLIMAIEDLHWIDKSSEGGHLIDLFDAFTPGL